eukprot:c28499_g1_i1 orf=2-199(-)
MTYETRSYIRVKSHTLSATTNENVPKVGKKSIDYIRKLLGYDQSTVMWGDQGTKLCCKNRRVQSTK